MNKKFLIIIIFFLLFVLIIQKNKNFEEFNPFMFMEPIRSTRGMSYDIRCNPYIAPKYYNFQSPSYIPEQNRNCIYYDKVNNRISL